MIIKHYYKFKKEPEKKSKYSLIANAGNYEPLDFINKKNEKVVYLSEARNIHSKSERKPVYRIGNGFTKKGHLTSLFLPDFDFEKPNLFYGDFRNDLWLFKKNKNYIEIFIIPENKDYSDMIFSMFYDGEFDTEIKSLRDKANSQ